MLRFITISIGIILCVSVALAGSFVWDSFLLSSPKNEAEMRVEILSGSSVDDIAKQLEKNEVITSAFFFKVYVKLFDVASSLQAGEFLLKKHMTIRAVVTKLQRAEIQETQITIPEGYTLAQMADVLSLGLPNVSKKSWQEVTSQPETVGFGFEILRGIPSGQTLEGYLFPDTYRFVREADAKMVASKMLQTLMKRLVENEITVPTHLRMENEMTFHELLTLASIVEREVRSPDDMAHIAGIFLTRLKIGMALQADSTVNFVTGKKDAAVSLEDSRVDSSYNTYKHLGLPPGPICNPGMNAIKAVLTPTESDDLYFLTTPDGEVKYAKTFPEHVRNKQMYLK